MILMHANDLLDWRIIENGSFVPNITVSSINGALEEMIDLMNSTLVNRDLKIVKEFSKNVYALAKFDKRRLQQVLLNLLSNAIKFSQRGKITVMACIEIHLDQGTILSVKVKDEGIGLTIGVFQELFKPFKHTAGQNT